MEQRQHFDRVGRDAIDEDVVGVHHCLAGAGDAARAVEGGMLGQAIRSVADRGVQAVGRRLVAGADIVEDRK